MAERVRVPAVSTMDDETLIKHMDARHKEDNPTIHLGYAEPDRAARGLPPRLNAPAEWRTYHDKVHELFDGHRPYDHIHKEPSDAD